jgi:hypothetical protein
MVARTHSPTTWEADTSKTKRKKEKDFVEIHLGNQQNLVFC